MLTYLILLKTEVDPGICFVLYLQNVYIPVCWTCKSVSRLIENSFHGHFNKFQTWSKGVGGFSQAKKGTFCQNLCQKM